MLFNKTRGKCSRGVCRPWRPIYFEGDDVLSAFESGQEGLIIGEWRAKKRWEVRRWLCLHQANISALTFLPSILHSYYANIIVRLYVKCFSKMLCVLELSPHDKGFSSCISISVCLYTTSSLDMLSPFREEDDDEYCFVSRGQGLGASVDCQVFNFLSRWPLRDGSLRCSNVLNVRHCCFGCSWGFEDLHWKIKFNTFLGF